MTKSWRLIRFSKTADKLDFLSSCKLGDACGAPLVCSVLKERTAVRGSTKLESTAPMIFSSSDPGPVQGTFTARFSWPDPVKAEKTRICREVPAANTVQPNSTGMHPAAGARTRENPWDTQSDRKSPFDLWELIFQGLSRDILDNQQLRSVPVPHG